MLKAMLIFLGGGAGSVLRYAIGLIVVRTGILLPLATFVSNITACLVFALALLLTQHRGITETMRLTLLVGFCGGLSTFSAFSFETFQLVRQGMLFWAIGNVALSVLACLLIFYIFER